MHYLIFAICLTILATFASPARAKGAQVASADVAAESVVSQHLSAEEKRWLKTFYEGNLLADGWHEITTYLLSRTPEEERLDQRVALDNLGRKIVLEWVRPNHVRKVDTDMLRDWGGVLKKTAKQNPQQLAQVIATIDQELEAVLD
ncbi:MAG: hypothetical protein RBT36_06965 [Desulfobulbus sp.]|nr:hypothetical protein [Desulfobulbus sp.]